MPKTTIKAENIVTDAGYVYVNYKIEGKERAVGATSGGNSFVVEREIKQIEVDNLRGKTKGLRRTIRQDAQLTVNIRELSPENIKMAFSADVDDTDPDKYVITPKNEIDDEDYLENVVLVAPVFGSGKFVEIYLYNALPDGESIELNLEDENEGVIPVQLSAHYDPDDISVVPYKINYPKLNGNGGGEE
jgi:hypothetical protein